MADTSVAGERDANNSSPPSSEELSKHLSDLPRELYDEIWKLVFTAEPGPRRINKHYKTPRLLQVDRSSRQHFAKSYYGDGALFIFHEGSKQCIDYVSSSSRATCERWLVSLEEQYLVDKVLYSAYSHHVQTRQLTRASEELCRRARINAKAVGRPWFNVRTEATQGLTSGQWGLVFNQKVDSKEHPRQRATLCGELQRATTMR